MKELISVIIPTFNSENTIIRAVESVLNQTYDKLEVIVVDDGSTDRTPDLLKNIVDERVRYYANYENVGPLGARNWGIDLARGTYVAFQDSDDVWNKDKIEKQVKRVPSSNNDLSFSKGSQEKINTINYNLLSFFSISDIFSGSLPSDTMPSISETCPIL